MLLNSITENTKHYEEYFPSGFIVRDQNPFEKLVPYHGLFLVLDTVHCKNVNKDMHKGKRWISRKKLKVKGLDKI